MRAGAVDYLLKPSSKEDIIQIIDEITENIEETVPLQKNAESFGMLKRNILNRLPDNNISPMELKGKMEVPELALPVGPCCVGLVDFNREEAGRNNGSERRWTSVICVKESLSRRKRALFFECAWRSLPDYVS